MAINWRQVFQQQEYQDARRERNALELMEIGFKQEERKRQQARQEESDTRQREKFEDYETTQSVLDIESKFKPLTTTLSEPSNITRDDLLNIKNSLYTLSKESSNYKEGSIEMNALNNQLAFVDNLVENTEGYLDANEKFDRIRASINENLVKDENAGAYNIKDTADIVNNAQSLLTSKYARQNKAFASAVSALTEESKRYAFVAGELKRYQDNPDAIGNQKTMVDLARRAAKEEDINLAYNILAKVPEDIQRAQVGMPTSGELQNESLRQFAVSMNDQIDKFSSDSGVYKTQLQVIAQSISDEKGNFMLDPQRFEMFRASFEELMNKIQGETDSKFYPNFLPGKDNGFEPYEGIITQAKTGGTNDLESMALIASGAVRKQGKELVYVDGTVYMDASGQVVNPYTIDKYNEQWWQTHASKISSNIGKIGYKPGSKGNEDATSQAISRTAKMFLQFNPDIRARIPDEKKAPSGNLNEKAIREGIASEGKDKEPPKDDSKTKTKSNENIAGDKTSGSFRNVSAKSPEDRRKAMQEFGYDAVPNLLSQVSENLKTSKQKRASKNIEKIKLAMENAPASKIPQLKKQLDRQQKILEQATKEALASK